MFGQRIEAARSRLRSSVAVAKKIEDMVSTKREVRNARAGLRLDKFSSGCDREGSWCRWCGRCVGVSLRVSAPQQGLLHRPAKQFFERTGVFFFGSCGSLARSSAI